MPLGCRGLRVGRAVALDTLGFPAERVVAVARLLFGKIPSGRDIPLRISGRVISDFGGT